MEVDSCPKEGMPEEQVTEPCCSQKNVHNDSEKRAVKVPIQFHFTAGTFSNFDRRDAERSLTVMRRRNIAAQDEDLAALCMQMEDMNADKGFKHSEAERKKRILQRLRALVASYKKGNNSDED